MYWLWDADRSLAIVGKLVETMVCVGIKGGSRVQDHGTHGICSGKEQSHCGSASVLSTIGANMLNGLPYVHEKQTRRGKF